MRHYQLLCEHLGMKFNRLPSDSTFRRLFEQLDFEKLTDCFVAWAKVDTNIQAGEWLAVDGKSIKSTLTGQVNYSYFRDSSAPCPGLSLIDQSTSISLP
ncbi:hypothetical protein H6G66_15870 [Fischerella sp. FACHB-380]|nr:hypothetical protein [Fischerella sp. FACHB-380]